MRIQMPEFLNIGYFYQFTMHHMMVFYHDKFDHELIIDLGRTHHIDNGVLCDLLSYFAYLRKNKECFVYLLFGTSNALLPYLEYTDFFLHASQFNIITDLLVFGDRNASEEKRELGREENTERVNIIPIPPISNEDMVDGYKKRKIRFRYASQSLSKDISNLFHNKRVPLANLGLTDSDSILSIYYEIMENSYIYSNESTSQSCFSFYTFQYYGKAGLTFSSSDYGPGFYETMNRQLHTHNNSFKQNESNSKSYVKLKVFSELEFNKLGTDDIKRPIAGIIEALCRWLPQNDCGFPFLFNELILRRNGTLLIHTENILLNITRSFLEENFVIDNETVIGIRQYELKNIALNNDKQDKLIEKGYLKQFAYCFPGVHTIASIKTKRCNK